MPKEEFVIDAVAPFRLDLTTWALRRRAHNTVDRWDGETYRRAIVVRQGSVMELAVTQITPPENPRIRVSVTNCTANPANEKELCSVLERLLGLHFDMQSFYAMAKKDRYLSSLAEQFRGLKPPRFPNLFEAFVNGVACQQISLTAGITLLNRLAEHFGAHTVCGNHVFPTPGELAGNEAGELRSLGFSLQKARAILELADKTATDRFNLESIALLDNEAAMGQMLQLRGVGRWTAEYLLLRGLGRPEIFPGDDVGARRRLARWLHRPDLADYRAVTRVVRRWQPYAGLVYFHLLINGLAEQGVIKQEWDHSSA